MQFLVIPNRSRVPSEGQDIGYLWTDNWNDWWRYQTLYVLTYFDAQGEKHRRGPIYPLSSRAWTNGSSL